MRSWIERGALALAHLDANPRWVALQLPSLVSLVIVMPFVLVGGLALGYPGLFVGVGVGAAVAFGLSAYGRRLERPTVGRVHGPKQRREAVSKLLEANAGRLTSERVGDARLMIEAGLESEALLLIVDDLRASSVGLESFEVEALKAVASKLGVKIDLEPRPGVHQP